MSRLKIDAGYSRITLIEAGPNQHVETPIYPPSGSLIRQTPEKRPASAIDPVLHPDPEPHRRSNFFN